MHKARMKASQAGGPPDGGYGWVVVTSAFFIMGLSAGVLKNFGLFFLEIQNHFGVLTSTTSWVTSTMIVVFHLGAPIASVLSMHFTQRSVIIVGGLLAASGMMLASLDLSLPWMYLSIGILQGLGLSFSWVPANSMWLIEAYTWQGALLIIGSLQLNLCVCGSLMRPLVSKPQSPTKPNLGQIQVSKSTAEPTPKKKLSFQWSLLRKPELLFYILFAILAAVGFFIPPLFLVPYATSLGLENYWAASILSVLALADLFGRLACGWLANLRLVRNLQLLTMVVTMLGVVLLLLPIGKDYGVLLVFSLLCGFLFGCVVAIHVTSIVDVVGLESFDSGLGLFMLFRSIGGFIGPPAAGWLVDLSSGYAACFYLSGLVLILSGVFVVLVDRLVERKIAATSESYLEY
ncbi:monocarboxylate transporter 2 isoform X2 [Esox lucius]|uniref:monocarboxylate transporter 2 isoform X2 n=1 Tax=Esox lucius TaxID=8010 RepID=UPI0014775C07|nr:monocarboxylate transporter 2 isoform X2 [Esox lucius]